MFFATWSSTIIVTLVLGLIAFKFYYKPYCNSLANDPFTETEYPQHITGLGVLGTFIGITIALLGFEPNDLQKSIPILLDGMKTAFITSIAGMVVSIYMVIKQKIIQKKHALSNSNTVNEDATIADLLRYFQEQNEYQKEQNIKILEVMSSNSEILQNTIKVSLEQMTKSIVGDGESTLITQLKLMRSESNDNQRALKEELQNSNNELITEFKNFANYMTENTNKAFIKALEDVIRDFNSNLTEQFGENFKQLNEAVKELVNWQENYKNLVIEVTENQRVIFSGIGDVKNSLAEIASSSEQIYSSAEKLSDIVVTSATYHTIIEKALYNLNYIGKESQEFIPSLNKLAETFENTIKSEAKTALDTASVLNEKIINDLRETNKLAGQHYETMDNSLKENINSQNALHVNAISTITSISEKATNQIEVNSANISTAATTAIDEVNMHAAMSTEAIEKFAKVNLDTINKEIEAIQIASSRLENSTNDITKRISDNLHKMAEENNKSLKTSTENTSKALETQLNSSLKTLGEHLASVSEKFVTDYTPLTQRLKEVVEIAKDIKR